MPPRFSEEVLIFARLDLLLLEAVEGVFLCQLLIPHVRFLQSVNLHVSFPD